MESAPGEERFRQAARVVNPSRELLLTRIATRSVRVQDCFQPIAQPCGGLRRELVCGRLGLLRQCNELMLCQQPIADVKCLRESCSVDQSISPNSQSPPDRRDY